MKSLLKLGLIGALAGVGATLLYAAPEATPPDAQLNDLLGQADLVHSSATADMQHVVQLQETARKSKDIIKLNCVNDKLVQMKPQMNVLEQMQNEMRSSQNVAAAAAQVTQAGQNMRQLRDGADQCAGESIIESESANSYTGPNHPDLPYGNPWENGSSVVEPPNYASPYD